MVIAAKNPFVIHDDFFENKLFYVYSREEK